MSSNAICYKNRVKSKTINGAGYYLGATPPKDVTPPEDVTPTAIFSFDQRKKNHAIISWVVNAITRCI